MGNCLGSSDRVDFTQSQSVQPISGTSLSFITYVFSLIVLSEFFFNGLYCYDFTILIPFDFVFVFF